MDIACAQLCGLGRYRMKGECEILPPADFEQWVATAGLVEEFEEDEDE